MGTEINNKLQDRFGRVVRIRQHLPKGYMILLKYHNPDFFSINEDKQTKKVYNLLHNGGKTLNNEILDMLEKTFMIPADANGE